MEGTLTKRERLMAQVFFAVFLGVTSLEARFYILLHYKLFSCVQPIIFKILLNINKIKPCLGTTT